jgi:ABC-type glycerol-3-phosphate transport system substrate-binding protein
MRVRHIRRTKETFALYKRMYDEGITDSSARNDDGSTWSAGFIAGKVGILLHGSLLVNQLKEEVTFDWGAAPLGSPAGSSRPTPPTEKPNSTSAAAAPAGANPLAGTHPRSLCPRCF